jgi:hypothetical protein
MRRLSAKTPEAIVQRFPSVLLLADVYGVIAYYLRHRAEIEQHMGSENGKRARHNGESRAASATWQTFAAVCSLAVAHEGVSRCAC